MLENIKLTQKQQQVLETLKTILEKENFKKIPVSDIYCEMTAVKKIVAANWFDRTFNKLEELGLVEKEDMTVEIKDGYRKGEIVETYCYSLTELGLEYFGMTIDDIPVTVDPVEEVQPKTKEQEIQENIEWNIKAADDRLPKGYQVGYKDNQYCILNEELEEIVNIQDIPQSDYIVKNEYVWVENAFRFVHYANVLLEELEKEHELPVEELEVEELETETIRPQLLEMSTKATGIRLAVINSILDQGDTDAELINYIDNVLLHGCVDGAVPDLIYYKDTQQFYKEHCLEITELLDSYYQEFRTLPVDELTPNTLSWWSYEYLLDDIAQKLDLSNVDSKVL